MLFEGNRLSTEAFLRSITGQYYVYVLCRPDGRPFYVGKGLNKRALDHEAEARRNHPIGESNPFKCNVIRKIVRDGGEVIYRIDAAFTALYQQDCLEHEALLIKRHGRLHEGGAHKSGRRCRQSVWRCTVQPRAPRKHPFRRAR